MAQWQSMEGGSSAPTAVWRRLIEMVNAALGYFIVNGMQRIQSGIMSDQGQPRTQLTARNYAGL